MRQRFHIDAEKIRYAIETRRRTFLEHSDWKHVPWSECALPKLPMQTLADVEADIPGLLQDSDELQAQSDAGDAVHVSSRQENLYDRVLSTLSALFNWRFQFEQDYPSLAHTVTIDPPAILTHMLISDDYAARSFWFARFDRAQELLCYNAAVLVMLQLLEAWNLTARIGEVLPNSAVLARPLALRQPLLLPSPAITPKQVLEEIHRSVPYFLHSMHSKSGFLALYYPLWCWYVIQLT